MNKKIAALSAALFASALALSACGGSSAAPAETVYVQVPAQEAPAPVQDSDDALVNSVMEDVWNDLSYEDKELMCWGYNNARSDMWESFNSGSGGLTTYEQWERFFGGKCA